MVRRSCLDGRAGPVVADTSVVINLHATGRAEAVLRALPNWIFGALYRGRMRVPEHYGPWVVEVIGRERAARCRSLPKRFRPGGAGSG